MVNYISYSSPTTFKSRYNPIVGLHPDFVYAFNRDFLHPYFLQLCEALGIHQGEFEFLDIDKIITEKEFESKDELAKPYFYEILFERIFKNEKGRIRNRIKFSFTYDIELTPIQKGNIRYGTINLGSKPVFYYCYVDLQEVINFIKKLE